jgi:hypothetical protein
MAYDYCDWIMKYMNSIEEKAKKDPEWGKVWAQCATAHATYRAAELICGVDYCTGMGAAGSGLGNSLLKIANAISETGKREARDEEPGPLE